MPPPGGVTIPPPGGVKKTGGGGSWSANSGTCGVASIVTAGGAVGNSASAKFFSGCLMSTGSASRSARIACRCFVFDSCPSVRSPGERALSRSEKVLARCTAALARSTPVNVATENAVPSAIDTAAALASAIRRRLERAWEERPYRLPRVIGFSAIGMRARSPLVNTMYAAMVLHRRTHEAAIRRD